MKNVKYCKNHPGICATRQCQFCGNYFCYDCVYEGPVFYHCSSEECLQKYELIYLPVHIDCPNCQTQLELNNTERIKRAFKCPVCKAAIKWSGTSPIITRRPELKTNPKKEKYEKVVISGEQPLSIKDFILLFKNPKLFFSGKFELKSKIFGSLALFSLSFSYFFHVIIALQYDKINDDTNFFEMFFHQNSKWWILYSITFVVYTSVWWYFNAFGFSVLVIMSGTKKYDHLLNKHIFVYSSLISSIPINFNISLLITGILDWSAFTITNFLCYPLIIWAAVVAYKGVTAYYDLNRHRAFVLLVVVPMLIVFIE